MQQIGDKFYIIFLVLLTGGVLYLLAPILTPFLVGALLAYLADPLVNQLVRLRLPRLLSVVIVFSSLFSVMITLILLLIPLIEKQIATLVIVIPNIIAWIQNTIVPWLVVNFNFNEGVVNVGTLKTLLAQNWTKAGGVADWILKEIVRSGFKLIEWITNLVLIPVVTFYLLCDWNKVISGVRSLLPRDIEPTVVKLTKECDSVLSAFFRGQLLVMLALGILYSIGLNLIGLQIGLLIGLMAGAMGIVPYLGFIVGIVIASVAAFVQFGNMTPVFFVWFVFVVGHTVEHVFLTPKLVGNRIGLHPVAVIFAILAGGSLFGFMGVLLALPVAAVIMVWVRHLHKHYRNSQLYQST